MRLFVSTVALALVASAPAAFAQSSQSKMDNADASALKQLVQANLTEVASGKAAQSKAQSPDVKNFAQKMVTDHGKMAEELKSLAKKNNVSVPQDANLKDMAQMKLMERKSGAEFDQAYMEHMVKDHEKDIKDAQDIAAKAKDPEFKAAVNKAIPVMQQHLKLAQQISKSAAAGSSSKSKSK